MLLRRITQHVKDQNWFAVFVDFVIVVVGVFIGIQVANWNEERAERGAEAEYLVALEQDVLLSLAEIERMTTILNQEDEARKTLYEFSLSAKDSISSSEWPELINRGLWSFRNFSVSNTTFESLSSSGRINILDDHTLVVALQELSSLLIEAEKEDALELHFVEKFGDPLLYENIDMGAVFKLRSLNDTTRVYVPWVEQTSGAIGNPETLKTQQFRNALLFRASMTNERLLTLERIKAKYQSIQKLINKRKNVLGL